MCENTVNYYVPKGYDYKEIFGVCGQTGYDGERLICHDCANDPRKMAEIEYILLIISSLLGSMTNSTWALMLHHIGISFIPTVNTLLFLEKLMMRNSILNQEKNQKTSTIAFKNWQSSWPKR